MKIKSIDKKYFTVEIDDVGYIGHFLYSNLSFYQQWVCYFTNIEKNKENKIYAMTKNDSKITVDDFISYIVEMNFY